MYTERATKAKLKQIQEKSGDKSMQVCGHLYEVNRGVGVGVGVGVGEKEGRGRQNVPQRGWKRKKENRCM